MTMTQRMRRAGEEELEDEQRGGHDRRFEHEDKSKLGRIARQDAGTSAALGPNEDADAHTDAGTRGPGRNAEAEKQEDESDGSAVDVPPDGGYGWVCVVCIALINAHTWGLNSSYGVFLAYYLANDHFPGASRLEYAFIGGLSISQALVVSPLATLTTRVCGTRTTLLIGVALETASFVGASFATRIWHLFLSQGVCFGWGMGFLFVGSVVITPQWFTTRRSLANGIAAAGSGLGGLVYSLAAQAMIRRLSLAWAFRVLAAVACVVNTACSLVVRDRNKQIGSSQLSFDTRLFAKVQFLGLLAFGFLSMLGYVVLLFSLPNYARTVRLSSKQGSVVSAVLNLGQALGRPPIGYFSDTFGRLNMAASMTALCGVLCLVVWIFARSYGVLIFFAIVGGMVAGTFWAVVAPVTTEVMGIVDLPAALSITWLVLVLPTTFSEAIGLQLVQYHGGSYQSAILFAGFMYLGAAMLLWLVRAWKIGELEDLAARTGVEDENIESVGNRDKEVGDGAHRSTGRSGFGRRMVVWRRV